VRAARWCAGRTISTSRPLVSLEEGPPANARSIGVGSSPGDDYYAQPYFYISPWPRFDGEKLPDPPAPGHWHTEGFFGAVLTGDEVLAMKDRGRGLMGFITAAFDIGRTRLACTIVIARLALFALACAIQAGALAQYPSRPARVLGRIHSGGRRRHQRAPGRLEAQRIPRAAVRHRESPGRRHQHRQRGRRQGRADGYTLLFNSPAVAINMSLYKNPPYDALRDLAAVSVFSESTNILVVPASLPVKSVKELIALAKEKPGALNLLLRGPRHHPAPRRGAVPSCAPGRASCTCLTRAARPRSPRSSRATCSFRS